MITDVEIEAANLHTKQPYYSVRVQLVNEIIDRMRRCESLLRLFYENSIVDDTVGNQIRFYFYSAEME